MSSRTISSLMWNKMFQVQKIPTPETLNTTELSRVLGILDLLSIGIGGTIGVGIYVIAGQVAKHDAGPSVILSFVVAGLASLLAGMCYAEFAGRVPRAGSAYVYSYFTVGEFVAFVIGWTLILEHAIGSAAITRAGSRYIDSMLGNRMRTFYEYYLPMDVVIFAEYPDLLALAIDLCLTVLLLLGVKTSTYFNGVLTCINLAVVLSTVVAFMFKADIKNWQIEKKEIPIDADGGVGGFFPFGIQGMIVRSATCFYTYIGFDCVATAGEETKNPQRNTPMAIILTVCIVAVVYCSLAALLTLVMPYYLLDSVTPIPNIFDMFGWTIAKYFVYIGVLCGLLTSLVGTLFPLSRILYAMGLDNVLFPILSHVSDRFKTPLVATLISGILTGLIAMMFSIEELIAMYSIGTLQSYAVVSMCVIVLRYRKEQSNKSELEVDWFHLRDLFITKCSTPTQTTERIVKSTIFIMTLMYITIAVCWRLDGGRLIISTWWSIVILILAVLICLCCIFCISRQPQNNITQGGFRVPLLPLLPSLSIFVNIYLMVTLSAITWIRFVIWMAVGFILYFGYGFYTSYHQLRIPQSTGSYEEKEDILLIAKKQ